MIERKFKEGMKVWSGMHGLCTLRYRVENNPFPLQDGHTSYTECGRLNIGDLYPVLYTLDEARAMGFPVPKEKLKVECYVNWKQSPSGTIYPFGHDLAELIGKRGRLIFEED